VTYSPASISVDRSSPVPLYYQVAQELERAIESGELPAGSRLENEIALADQLGLSRPTLRRAIEYLVDRGLLMRRRGVGTQVVQPKMRRPLELTSLYDDLVVHGKRPTTRVRTVGRAPAPDFVAHALGVEEGTPVVALERIRYADGEPLALMRNYLPEGLVVLTPEKLEQTGLYELMRARGLRPYLASQTVGARGATLAEARKLHDRKGAPLLTMRRTTYDAAGRALEFGDHVYRASLYSFEFVVAGR
jgi:DNA-binding GntR family transcriptional regulator